MKNRFKAVEMGIFAAVSMIFLNSVYNLFTDGKFIGDNELRPMALATKPAATGDKTVDTRHPASSESASGVAPYETKCQTTGEIFETTAAKIRILGPFCGNTGRQVASASAKTTAGKKGAGGENDASLIEYKIENVTSHYVATVFSDQGSAKFSTDFIPLEPGPNRVVMEFKYKGGKVYPVDLTIVKK